MLLVKQVLLFYLPQKTISSEASWFAGKAWTEDEHLAFLAGLKKLGRGQWRGISRYGLSLLELLLYNL